MLNKKFAVQTGTNGVDEAAANVLRHALDVDSFWKSCVKLVSADLPYPMFHVLYDFDGYQPRKCLYHARQMRRKHYVPSLSLSVAGPYLEKNPDRRFYSYSQILEADPQAAQRMHEQDPDTEFDDFVQMAFWHDGHLEAVFIVDINDADPGLTRKALNLFESVYPVFDESLARLRMLEEERLKTAALEGFLENVPIALMLVGFDGRQVFANAMARQLCARWNAGLSDTARRLRLPDDIDELLDGGPQGLDENAAGQTNEERCIRHPNLEGLMLHVGISWQSVGLRTRPCYVLRFVASGVGSSSVEDALLSRASAFSSGVPAHDAGAVALQSLTPRERRVALLAAEGLHNDEIAERLFRSRRTIESHLASIYRKLGISSRLQLVRLLG